MFLDNGNQNVVVALTAFADAEVIPATDRKEED